MRQTIEEWYYQVKDAHLREKLLHHAKNSRRDTLHHKVTSLGQAIGGGFTWRNTPEGRGYWMRVRKLTERAPEKFLRDGSYYKHKSQLHI